MEGGIFCMHLRRCAGLMSKVGNVEGQNSEPSAMDPKRQRGQRATDRATERPIERASDRTTNRAIVGAIERAKYLYRLF